MENVGTALEPAGRGHGRARDLVEHEVAQAGECGLRAKGVWPDVADTERLVGVGELSLHRE